MKKFFSILCAFAIVFSANAAQLSKKDILVGNAAKKEIRSQHVSNAKVSTFKSFTTTTATVAKVAPQTKHGIEGKAVAGVEKKVVKNLPTNALKAKKAAIDLSFTSADADVSWDDYCASQGWWQIQAETDEYYVTLSNLSTEEAAGEYAWEDLDPDYCGIWYEEAGGILAFTDGSCTVAVDETDGLKVTVEGSFVCEDGNTYNLHIEFAKEAIVAEDIEFVAISESHSFFSSDNDVYFSFTDADENVIHFDIIVAEGLEDVEEGKEYTLADMLESYSNVTYNEEKASFVEASFVKIPQNGGEKYEATATDTYGRKFHLTYTFIEPVAEQFETITADATMTKEAFWFWYIYTIEAADEANAIVLELIPDESIYGTWKAGKDITGAVTPLNGVESEIYSGEVTIEATAEGCAITGSVLCFNNTEYTLNLTYTKPGPTREEVLVVEGLALDVFDGAWQLSGYNEDSTKYVSIAAYTDEITGNYTDADLAADYCYVATDITEEGYNYFEMLSADLTVQFNEADSTIIIAGTFVGQNGEDIPQFNLALSGRIPAPEVSDMTFEFADEEDGILVTPSNEEDAWDWYVADAATLESFGGPEGLAQAVYDYYGTYFAEPGERLVSFEEMGNMLGSDGTYYLLVWGAGEREMTTEAFVHEFEYESGLPEGCTQYDAEEGNDFIVDFAEFELDERYVESYGVYLIDAQDADNHYLSLQIYAPEGLVAGEYPVLDDSEEAFTIAGELDLSQGKIYGSFAGQLTASGQISVPLWLLIDGKVTVNEDLSIDVDAVNCAGAKIQCHLANGEQGIENVKLTEDAKKVVVDGVLYIVRDNKMFNVQGTQVR